MNIMVILMIVLIVCIGNWVICMLSIMVLLVIIFDILINVIGFGVVFCCIWYWLLFMFGGLGRLCRVDVDVFLLINCGMWDWFDYLIKKCYLLSGVEIDEFVELY